MKTAIIIPARYASTRYPGKPLAELRTKEGKKTLIQLSWEAANKVSDVSEIYVATDCLLYTSPSPRDGLLSRMPSSA